MVKYMRTNAEFSKILPVLFITGSINDINTLASCLIFTPLKFDVSTNSNKSPLKTAF